MKNNRSRVCGTFALGIVALALSTDRPAMAAERAAATQPVLIPGGHYTRLLGAAPLKPPVLFADDDEAVAAKMETVGWYRYGAPTYAYYRGYGGWYGPWYGYRSYPYWGGYYGGMYGYYGSPFGYYGAFSPIGYPFYGAGYRPWSAYPYYTPVFNPPYLGGGASFYAPYGLAGYGGCCYW